MIRSRMAFYPNLRKDFSNMTEIAELINRSVCYVRTRMNGQNDFTYREMCMIANASGVSTEDARDYCRKEV